MPALSNATASKHVEIMMYGLLVVPVTMHKTTSICGQFAAVAYQIPSRCRPNRLDPEFFTLHSGVRQAHISSCLTQDQVMGDTCPWLGGET